jgi:hypothetical protein
VNSDALHRRARAIRARALVRQWEYRQRDLAKGVWYRFRRALVDAAEAYAIPSEEAERLRREGHVALPVGDELEPPKVMFFVSPARLAEIEGRQRIPLHLDDRLLGARYVALVRFS